jgi:hypothetical protein
VNWVEEELIILKVAYFGLLLAACAACEAVAQSENSTAQSSTEQNSTEQFQAAARERDLIDVAGRVLNLPPLLQRDANPQKSGRLYPSGSISPGYSLSTGASAVFAANGAFYTSEDTGAKISNVSTDLVYTQKRQLIFDLQSNLWAVHNRYNFVTDWRYYSYTQRTYGLGPESHEADYVEQSYDFARLHQTALRALSAHLFAGVGYAFDRYYNITQIGSGPKTLADLAAYGVARGSTSAGLNFALLFDDRANSINPWGGTYVNVVYRPNLTALGSDTNWQSLLVDVRRYVRFPASSDNILAFWSYDWLTLSGKPPYLDLPSTGWDTYGNLGRGYIQGRFRGRDLIYLETEYRFGLRRDGLLGGVVFVNAESVSQWPSNQLGKVAPAAGVGIRLKFNKFSRTNVAVDYGFGRGDSEGIFVNLGEVF